jgi:hypothetical protein
MLRKFASFFVIAAFLLTSFPSAEGAPGDAFDPLKLSIGSNDLMNYVVEDGAVQTGSLIAIYPPSVDTAGVARIWKWCESLSTEICDPAKNPSYLQANSTLGPCESPTQENCIESLAIGKDPKNLVTAKLIRKTKGITFEPSPQYNFPGGSTISLWDVPGVPSAGGLTTYAITSTMKLNFRNGSFQVDNFYAGVTPYREETGNYRQTKINPDPTTPAERKYMWGSDQFCVFAEDGLCGVAQDFSSDTYIKLQLRIPNQVGGWFRGRIKDQILDVAPFSSKNNLLTIEAAPVTVSRLTIPLLKSNFTDQEKVWWTNNGQWGNGIVSGSGPQAGIPRDSFPFIAYYRDRLKDTSSGSNTFWNVSTTAWGYGSKCLQDKSKILGVVSTNSLAYDGGSPSFTDGALNYRVSGLHLKPDGQTPVLGTYNLVMRSEVARCLYGFTSAPIQAFVSITGGDTQVIATTVTGESKGWLSLSAAGFTFSEKTIKVKISQEATKSAEVITPTPVVKPAAAKKTTITCVKGKTSKKVTAVKPVCPAGYKKK